VYKSLIDYDSKAFQEISPYSIMKAWHWAMPRIYRAKADYDVAADLCEKIPRGMSS
jgi:DNA ligase-4